MSKTYFDMGANRIVEPELDLLFIDAGPSDGWQLYNETLAKLQAMMPEPWRGILDAPDLGHAGSRNLYQ